MKKNYKAMKEKIKVLGNFKRKLRNEKKGKVKKYYKLRRYKRKRIQKRRKKVIWIQETLSTEGRKKIERI